MAYCHRRSRDNLFRQRARIHKVSFLRWSSAFRVLSAWMVTTARHGGVETIQIWRSRIWLITKPIFYFCKLAETNRFSTFTAQVLLLVERLIQPGLAAT